METLKRSPLKFLNETLHTYSCHPSIVKINAKTTNETFSFSHFLPWETHRYSQ